MTWITITPTEARTLYNLDDLARNGGEVERAHYGATRVYLAEILGTEFVVSWVEHWMSASGPNWAVQRDHRGLCGEIPIYVRLIGDEESFRNDLTLIRIAIS